MRLDRIECAGTFEYWRFLSVAARAVKDGGMPAVKREQVAKFVRTAARIIHEPEIFAGLIESTELLNVAISVSLKWKEHLRD